MQDWDYPGESLHQKEHKSLKTYPSNIDRSKVGGCFLIHGPTSGGKTRSALTMDDPILFINKEPKDPRTVHGVDHGKDITYVEPEDYEDEMKFLNDLVTQGEKGTLRYKSIFHDGLTFSNAVYKQIVEDDRFSNRALSKNDLPRPGMTDKFRMERPDWGIVAGMMSRETFLLNKLSRFGVVVVSTAISAEYPKWNQSIRIAPSLIGQEFPKLVHGYFDYIGYIIQPFKFVNGEPLIPHISFVPIEDEAGISYMARCSSDVIASVEARGKYCPLHWGKIMKAIRGV